MDEFETAAVTAVTNEAALRHVADVAQRANALKDAADRQAAWARSCAMLGVPVTTSPSELAKASIARKALVISLIAGARPHCALLNALAEQLGCSHDAIWDTLWQQNSPLLGITKNEATGGMILPEGVSIGMVGGTPVYDSELALLAIEVEGKPVDALVPVGTPGAKPRQVGMKGAKLGFVFAAPAVPAATASSSAMLH